jgi:hypothetical protein
MEAYGRDIENRSDAINDRLNELENPTSGTHEELNDAGLKDSHHIVQDAAVRNLPGYDRDKAPAVQLPGPSTTVGTPHYSATRVQDQAGGGTLGAEFQIAYKALRSAGVSVENSRALVQTAANYFSALGYNASTVTRVPGNR